jgi:hypothetical protein
LPERADESWGWSAILVSFAHSLPTNAGKRTKRYLGHDAEKWKPVFRRDHAPLQRQDHCGFIDRIMV